MIGDIHKIAFNNPLNIRSVQCNRWKGLTGSVSGLCTFQYLECGVRAAGYILMTSFRQKGYVTYEDIIKHWPSPSGGKDDYIVYVCSELNKSFKDIPGTLVDFANLIYVMWQFEQKCLPSYDLYKIIRILQVYNLHIWKLKS